MKAKDIYVGDRYAAKVSGRIATVRVDAIREASRWNGKATTLYDVTNLETKRKTTFRSAARFRSAVVASTGQTCHVPGQQFADLVEIQE